ARRTRAAGGATEYRQAVCAARAAPGKPTVLARTAFHSGGCLLLYGGQLVAQAAHRPLSIPQPAGLLAAHRPAPEGARGPGDREPVAGGELIGSPPRAIHFAASCGMNTV